MTSSEKPGYHITTIKKGVLGEISKIREELDELEDADNQQARIMCLLELADLVGAIEAYLQTNFPGFTLDDLTRMSFITKRAFLNGHR